MKILTYMTTSKFKYRDQEIERLCWKVISNLFISIEYTSCHDVISFKLENLGVFCLQTFSTIKFLLTQDNLIKCGKCMYDTILTLLCV